MRKTKQTDHRKITDRRDQLANQHYDLTMSIALQAVRVDAMQKDISKKAEELFSIESEIERLDAEANGKGLN